MKRIVIAAPQSGSGKTVLTLGIMAALKKRGLKIAPFKVGPDFIDPGYHRLATGTPSVNLDGWMCGKQFVHETFAHHAAGADVAVVEGVMGLFDGIDGVSEAGSTAEIAKLLGAPVVLVVDARSQARSAAALVHGFVGFDPALTVAGVVFNNVASANHERILREAVGAHCPGVTLLGCIPRDPALVIPSRHLGLLTAEENPLSVEFLAHLAAVVEKHLDLEALLELDRLPTAPPLPPGEGRGEGACHIDRSCSVAAPSPLPLSRGERGTLVKIAVARDTAFCFAYQDNLRLLRESGAELCFFSPLADGALPAGVSGIYLPGGYPELFAQSLAENRSLKEEIRAAIESGMPAYAECGGFIYLTRGVREEELIHPLVGIFPVEARMLPRRKALGYREVEFSGGSVIGSQGAIARGHEFHYSEMDEMPAGIERLYRVSRKGVALGNEGYRHKNCLASYIHLHFGSSPGIAASFVENCRNYLTGSHT